MGADTKTEIVRVMYRCKHHKITIRRTFEQVKHFMAVTEWYGSVPIQRRRVVRVEFFEGGVLINNGFIPQTACPESGHQFNHMMEAAPIKGYLVEHNACNGKCLNAVGPTCECSCAGDNHGKAYEVMASITPTA